MIPLVTPNDNQGWFALSVDLFFGDNFVATLLALSKSFSHTGFCSPPEAMSYHAGKQSLEPEQFSDCNPSKFKMFFKTLTKGKRFVIAATKCEAASILLASAD